MELFERFPDPTAYTVSHVDSPAFSHGKVASSHVIVVLPFGTVEIVTLDFETPVGILSETYSLTCRHHSFITIAKRVVVFYLLL